LGPYDYGLTSSTITPEDVPEPFRGPHFISKICRFNPTRFGTAYKPELDKAPYVTVYLNANALGFDTNEASSEVQELRVATLSGTRFRMRARIYVLAAGGIENARLLLLSGKSDKGLGNERDLVGRFFMVHLTYSGGAIAVSDPYMNVNFANSLAAQPHDFFSYIGLSDETMRAMKLPNFRFTVEYKFANVIRAVEALKQLGGANDPEVRWADVQKVVRDLDGLAKFSVRKAFSLQAMPIEAMILHNDSEQLPNPASRVSLGSKRDALGLQEVVLDWCLTAEDKRHVNAAHRLLGSEVGRAGFGRLRYMLDEDDTTWPEDLRGNEHHMGTTRMNRDSAKGVVDENCRVHGLANLYVAGSSIFPTGGVANPTLTIVTLALRLADHIKERLA
jgi:choline dehydrogenase-like flavoprotein